MPIRTVQLTDDDWENVVSLQKQISDCNTRFITTAADVDEMKHAIALGNTVLAARVEDVRKVTEVLAQRLAVLEHVPPTQPPIVGEGDTPLDPTAGEGTGVIVDPTPVDAVLSEWSAWQPLTPWVLNPADPTQEMRTIWRERTIVTPASGGGWTPPAEDLEDTKMETRPLVVAPPSVENPFAWHNELRHHPNFVRGWMMRDEVEVQDRVRRKYIQPRHTHYVWPNDPFADAQDAAKVIIPGSRSLPPLADGTPAASHSNYEQSIYPISIGANFLNRDFVRAVVAFEFYNDRSWFTENATCEKSFNFMRHHEVIAFEMRQRFRHRGGPPKTPGYTNKPMPDDGLAWFDVRSYGAVLPPHYVPDAMFTEEELARRGLTAPIPSGPRGNSDAIHPMMNWDFWQRWNVWNRGIGWIDFVRDDFYATCSIVVGDEHRDAVYLVKEARCPWPQRDRVTPGGMLNVFLHEWNSSRNRTLENGDMIAYLGPVLVFMDVEDPLALWQRPLRRGR